MTRRVTITVLSFLLALAAGAGSASALTPAPDTAEILFENGGRIVSIKADGSDRTVLTRKKAWVGQPWGMSDSGPTVSPDGSKVIFGRYYDGFEDGIVDGVMVMNRDGSDIHRLYEPPDDHEVWSGAWSADGTRIFVVEYQEDSTEDGFTSTSSILSMKPDGSDRRTVLVSSFEYHEKDESVTGQKMVPYDAHASPDGERLLIESANFVDDVPNRLEWVDIDTGERSLFEDDAGMASLSPDGSRVAFTSDRDQIDVSCYEGRCSGAPQIFIKEVGSGTVSHLLPGKPVESSWSPDWSPDGERIAFESTLRPGDSYVGGEIWTVAPDGSCLERLTNGAPDSTNPEWVPGGNSEACFDLNPSPLGEVTVGKRALEQKPRPLWAGPSFKGWLMNDTFLDGQDLGTAYSDCGDPDGDCPAPISISSGPVCYKNLSADLMLGQYLGLERRRGGLLVRNVQRPGVTLSHFYSGGMETRIASPGLLDQRKVGFGYHRSVVAALRPVNRNQPVGGELGPVVLPWTTVRKARAMVRAFARSHSLKKAAAQAGVFSEKNFIGVRPTRAGARAWLRFGRDLKRLGRVKSVRCRRWSNDPGTIEVRSRYRDFLK
ncbi:MAG: PD40 domain-containing protein [Solirubrobacterales bacterium]|nr:PD40 domain-containing protein [Solirubrobacterales bacterium]